MIDYLFHRWGLTNDKFLLPGLRLAQVIQFPAHGDDFACPADGFFQLQQVKRFLNKILRPIFHRVHRHADFSMGGDDDNLRSVDHTRGFGQEVWTVTVG